MDHQKINQNFEQYTAILLAAGYGSRISGLTEKPKCLLEINGETLLERNLKIWKNLGIKRVRVVLGYKDELIREVLKKYEDQFELSYLMNEDFRNKGNTYSLYVGINHWKEHDKMSLIFDADLIYDESILRDFLNHTNGQSSILTGAGSLEDIECAKVLVENTEGQNWVRMTVDKRAVSQEELSKYSFVGEALGILAFSYKDTLSLKNEAESFLAQEKNINLNWEHLLNVYFPHEQIGFDMTESKKWVEIDTPEDFNQAVEIFI